MSILTDLHRDDSLEAQKKKDHGELVDWEEHAKTLTNETEIQIEPNKYRFKNNKLVITKERFPNLTLLYACGLGLEKIELDCPTLENLYLVDNNITQINFKKTPNLKNLVLSKNKLRKLRVKHLKKLEVLRVNENWLINLDVRGLTKLINLDVSSCQRQEWRGYLFDDCFGNFESLKKVKLGNNPKLKTLDLAENDIKFSQFPPLPSLEEFSLRENIGCSHVFLRSPKLSFLDYKDSDIKEVKFHPKYPLENPNQLRICDTRSYNNPDGSYNPDVFTEWEDIAYQEQQKKLREDFEKSRHVYQGQTDLDLSGCDFIKSITIDGNVNYPKSLISINLGDNYLEEVIVRNLPNLARLIISHNNIKNLTIKNCPKLDKNGLIYRYKSGDTTRTPPPEGREYNEQRDNPFTREEQEQKREEERMKKFIKDLLFLIADIEKDANNGKWEKVKDKITNLKEWILLYPNWVDEEVNEKINRLEKRLLTSQTIQAQSKIRKTLIGFAFIIFLTLGILVLLINKMVKKIRRDG